MANRGLQRRFAGEWTLISPSLGISDETRTSESPSQPCVACCWAQKSFYTSLRAIDAGPRRLGSCALPVIQLARTDKSWHGAATEIGLLSGSFLVRVTSGIQEIGVTEVADARLYSRRTILAFTLDLRQVSAGIVPAPVPTAHEPYSTMPWDSTGCMSCPAGEHDSSPNVGLRVEYVNRPDVRTTESARPRYSRTLAQHDVP